MKTRHILHSTFLSNIVFFSLYEIATNEHIIIKIVKTAENILYLQRNKQRFIVILHIMKLNALVEMLELEKDIRKTLMKWKNILFTEELIKKV